MRHLQRNYKKFLTKWVKPVILVLDKHPLTIMRILVVLNVAVLISLFSEKTDMERIEEQYTTDARFYYMRGCMLGTDYPEEFRKIRGFNPYSKISYCSNASNGMIDYFESKAKQMGEKYGSIHERSDNQDQ